MSNKQACKVAELQKRRGRSHYDFLQYQYEATRGALEQMRRFTDIRHKAILDLGCGYGGASIYYALNGLRVTGVDNQSYESGFLKDAKNYAEKRGAGATFCLADAHHLPFKNTSFDLIRLDSVVEHLEYPGIAMSECYRILKPGGFLFVSFPLFYSPYGGHTIDYIKIPWFHILPAGWVRRMLAGRKSKSGFINTDYTWELYMSLNKMTLKRFKNLIRDSGLKEVFFEETFYMPHDAALFFNQIKESISVKSLYKLKGAFVHFNLASLSVFLFLYLLYRLPFRSAEPFNEFIVSGVRSVLSK
jgi:SAM-dependent methyltransferase